MIRGNHGRRKVRVRGVVLATEKDTVIGIETEMVTDTETVVGIIESLMTGGRGMEERVVIEAGHALLREGLVTEECQEAPFDSTSLRPSWKV